MTKFLISTLYYLFLTATNLFGQTLDNQGYVDKFNTIINSRASVNSLERIYSIAARGSSVDFIALSYNINAFTTMFEATKDIKYLEINEAILQQVCKVAIYNNGFPTWKASTDLARFKKVNETEVILFEGYLAKYFAEFLYVSKPHGLKHFQSQLLVLEKIFKKWHSRSITEFGDDSRVLGVRTHIGAQWAITALYLAQVTRSPEIKLLAKSCSSKYSSNLKRNLKLKQVNSSMIYEWNSTWDKPFTKLQFQRRNNRKDRNEIQDVTHGNHVVQFILSSVALGNPNWSNNDLAYLKNTLVLKIFNRSNLTFSDNIDGSQSQDRTLKGTGWKQSDGWMKLMNSVNGLYDLYSSFYYANKSMIDSSYLNLQFIANMANHHNN